MKDKKFWAGLGIGALVMTIIFGILAFSYNYTQGKEDDKSDNDVRTTTPETEANEDASEVVTMEFKTAQGTKFFDVKIDKDYIIDSLNEKTGDSYTGFEDNPNKYGSETNQFTYFVTENDMTSYFQYGRDHDYDLKYPNTEASKSLNETYIYYQTDPEDQTSYGLFYEWDNEFEVKEYTGSLITDYVNYLPTNTSTPYYKEESSKGSSYCVINLAQVYEDVSLTGYLVIHGSASAGSQINYCDSINELDTFVISR